MGFSKSAVISVAAALTLTSGAALAGSHGSYPSKPVKILVGFSAGGGTDTTSRGFASYMHEAERDSLPISLTCHVPPVKKLPKWFLAKRLTDILCT